MPCSFNSIESHPCTNEINNLWHKMRNFRYFFPFLPFLGVSESFVFVPIPSPKRSATSAANLHRHLASLSLSSATGSDSNYISFSADTGFLVSPSAFNALLDRFELRKRIGILLNHNLDSKCNIAEHSLNFWQRPFISDTTTYQQIMYPRGI